MNSLLEPLITNFLSPPHGSVTAASLGPCVIHTSRGIVMRKDVSIEGLSACLLEPASPKQRIKGTIIYCHSYNSNRSEVLELVPFLHQHNMNAVAFDFRRAREEGPHPDGIISFGQYEPAQLKTIVQWVIATFKAKVIIWGRSMGAFIALRYQIKYGDANGLILDSPYLSLEDLIAKSLKEWTHLPQFVIKEVLALYKPRLRELLGFDIAALEVLSDIQRCQGTPVVFVCSKNDPTCGEATEVLYEHYPGRKSLEYTDRQHHELREESVLECCFKEIRKWAVLTHQSSLTKKLSDKQIPSIASMHRLPRKSHVSIENSLKLKQMTNSCTLKASWVPHSSR